MYMETEVQYKCIHGQKNADFIFQKLVLAI